MAKAIYPGSFDPITMGHLDIVKRLAGVCTELTLVVANSPSKTYLFKAEERMALVQECLKGLSFVKVDIFDGLTVDYAKKVDANLIIRGVRGAADLEYEMTMAAINKKLNKKIETMILPADPEYSFVASRLVKEVAYYKGDLSQLVPPNVEKALIEKYK